MAFWWITVSSSPLLGLECCESNPMRSCSHFFSGTIWFSVYIGILEWLGEERNISDGVVRYYIAWGSEIENLHDLLFDCDFEWDLWWLCLPEKWVCVPGSIGQPPETSFLKSLHMALTNSHNITWEIEISNDPSLRLYFIDSSHLQLSHASLVSESSPLALSSPRSSSCSQTPANNPSLWHLSAQETTSSSELNAHELTNKTLRWQLPHSFPSWEARIWRRCLVRLARGVRARRVLWLSSCYMIPRSENWFLVLQPLIRSPAQVSLVWNPLPVR